MNINTLPFNGLGSVKNTSTSSTRLHLFDQKYSKNSNIVK